MEQGGQHCARELRDALQDAQPDEGESLADVEPGEGGGCR